ncbi:MAG: NIPSNAP family protein [Blastocatellia bacterium]
MLKKYLSLIAVLAATLTLGFWLGHAQATEAASAAAKNRVFELRTYYCNEGKLPDLQARFRDHTTKIFKRHGMANVGYWTPQDAPGSQNTLVYIISHDSREAAKKSWDDFRKDPEWMKVREASEANGKIVNKVDSVYLDPTDYSPIK